MIDVALEGELVISTATELKEKLARALEAGSGVRISLARVSAMDITGFQLLWAAAGKARAAGIPLTFAHPAPEEIFAGLRAAGLDPAVLLEFES
jgi:anti-anti-sigma regulatory factor